MRKTICALILVAVAALTTGANALAAPSEQGVTRGLTHACGQPAAGARNPNCGFAGQ
ncbi:MAG TPA: hypothetical protein VGM69_27025 [Chloroflexota bacterium]|jgi:hypothetical protein